MAAYTMNTDKTFLRCMDMTAMEVYELDSPYTFPVKGRSWMHLGIRIGPGKNYESLKIGDREINGGDLQTLIKDVFNSRLSVNREGLCFSATTGVTAVVLEVDYLRLFDLFDWSKYHVNTSLNTKWARSNFMDGRPLSILGANSSGNSDEAEYKKKLAEKEKELENEKLKHKQELEEMKHEEEEMKLKHKAELEEVKRNKKKELKEKQEEIDKTKEELKKKQEEIDRLKKSLGKAEGKKQSELDGVKKKNEELEKELQIYMFKKSGLHYTKEFYARMMQNMQITIPRSKFIIKKNEYFGAYNLPSRWELSGCSMYHMPFSPISDISIISDRSIRVECRTTDTPNDLDLENWRILNFASFYLDKTVRLAFAFYDGNKYYHSIMDGANEILRFPIPCPASQFNNYFLSVAIILGVGPRVVITNYECRTDPGYFD